MPPVSDTRIVHTETGGVGVVEDVALPWSRVFGRAYLFGLVACLAFIFLTYWIAWLFEIDELAAAAVSALPIAIVGEPVSNDIRRAKARRVIAAMKTTGRLIPPRDLLETLIRRMPMLGPDKALLSEFVSALVREGYSGLTVRLPVGRMPPVPAALGVPFEPRVLNDEDHATRNLLPIESDGHVNGTFWGGSAGSKGEGVATTLVRRWRNNAPLWAIVGAMAICTFLFVIAVLARNPGLWAAVLVLFGFVIVFMLLSPRHIFRREDWFIVPGGLVVRSRFRGKPTVHVFDRRECVMLIGPTMPQTRCWAAHVADAQGCSRAILSSDEVTVLLRAWRSPLRPPASERISDLT